MALTPHAKDPNRKQILAHMSELAAGGDEAQGQLRQDWNAGSKPAGIKDTVADAKPDYQAEAEAAAEKAAKEAEAKGKK